MIEKYIEFGVISLNVLNYNHFIICTLMKQAIILDNFYYECNIRHFIALCTAKTKIICDQYCGFFNTLINIFLFYL